MAIVATQEIVHAGLSPTYTAMGAAGDEVACIDDRMMLHVKNADTGAHTVTIDSKVPCNQGNDHDIAVSVPAGGERLIGPFPTARFRNASGRIDISVDDETDMTFAAFHLSQQGV